MKKQITQMAKTIDKSESMANQQQELLAKKDVSIDSLQAEKRTVSEALKKSITGASKVQKELKKQQSKHLTISTQLKQEKIDKNRNLRSIKKLQHQLDRNSNKFSTLSTEKRELNKTLKNVTAKFNRADKRISMLVANNISLHEEVRRLRKRQKTLLKQQMPQYDQLTLFDLEAHTTPNRDINEGEVVNEEPKPTVNTIINVEEDHPSLF